ncbi:MAG: hypothetical protein NQ127_04370, partial [Candidatus Cardinium sp.]|nr:hypothetical protein [Candidatus Cardinium sp.]
VPNQKKLENIVQLAGNCNKSKTAVPNQKKLENIVQLAGNCNKSKTAVPEQQKFGNVVQSELEQELENNPLQTLKLALQMIPLYPIIKGIEGELKQDLEQAILQPDLNLELRNAIKILLEDNLRLPHNEINKFHHLDMPLGKDLYIALNNVEKELKKSLNVKQNTFLQKLLNKVQSALNI